MAQFADGDRTGDIVLAITIYLSTEYSLARHELGFYFLLNSSKAESDKEKLQRLAYI